LLTGVDGVVVATVDSAASLDDKGRCVEFVFIIVVVVDAVVVVVVVVVLVTGRV